MPIHTLENGAQIMVGPEVDEHFKKPGLVHFIGMLIPPRPGVMECFQMLEHGRYPPGTPKNDDFVLTLMKMDVLTFGVVSIPESERPWMEEAAAACGLKVADGTPVLLTGGQTLYFPIRGENAFTLENVPGHSVYGKSKDTQWV